MVERDLGPTVGYQSVCIVVAKSVGSQCDDFAEVPMHVDTQVLGRQDALLGIDTEVDNSTNGWKVLEYLRDDEIQDFEPA